MMSVIPCKSFSNCFLAVMSPQGSRPHTPVLNAIRRVEDADRVPLLAQNPPPDEEEEEEEEEEEGVEWEGK